MTKISIENFQSIKKIDFEVKGLTVIIGKNNIGKSAVIRAIDAALNNQTGNNFIRKGGKKARVVIDYNGQKFEWIKSKTTASYNISGHDEPFTKLGGAIPQPLLDAGFQKIQIGDMKFFPLVTSQFDPLFLINKSGSVITEILANLYHIDTISTADDLCQKVIKSNKSLLKTRESDLNKLQLKLEKFKDFEEIKETVKSLAEKETEIENLREEITLISSYEKRIEDLLKIITDLKVVTKIKIPEKSECEKIMSELPWLQKTDDHYQKSLLTIKALKNVPKIKIPEKSECEKIMSELPWLQEIDDKYNKSSSLIKKLKGVPAISIPEKTEPEELLSEVIWIREKDSNYRKLDPLVQRLKSTSKIKIPKINKIGTLLKETIQVQEWDKTINKIIGEIKKQENVISTLDIKEVMELLEKTTSVLDNFLRIKVIEKEFLKIIGILKSTRTEKEIIDKNYNIANEKMGQFKICPLCERPRTECQNS